MGGVETVRSVLWSVNYPSRLRARITGRIMINTSIALAVTGVGVGWLLGHEGPWLAGGDPGRVPRAAWRARSRSAASRCGARRNCCRPNSRGCAKARSFGFAGMRALLAEDPAFRRYQRR